MNPKGRNSAMTNFNEIPLSYSGDEILEYDEIFNLTNIPVYVPEWNIEIHLILYSFIFVTCLFGLVGNGIVIGLLGFHTKRNAFTIYILNLAVADFGFLISVILLCLTQFDQPIPGLIYHVAECLFLFMFCTSQFLLTVISTDRSLSVLFPLWHRCLRPPHLSVTECALIWLLNFLPCGIEIIFRALGLSKFDLRLCRFLMNVVLCFPLIITSTLILLFKVCCKPEQAKRGKLLTVILLTLLVFLIVGSPFNVVVTCNVFSFAFPKYLFHYTFLCASLNSGIHPLIYFLVGKKKRGQVRENIKAILQRVFKEEEEFIEEPVHGQSGRGTVM